MSYFLTIAILLTNGDVLSRVVIPMPSPETCQVALEGLRIQSDRVQGNADLQCVATTGALATAPERPREWEM